MRLSTDASGSGEKMLLQEDAYRVYNEISRMNIKVTAMNFWKDFSTSENAGVDI